MVYCLLSIVNFISFDLRIYIILFKKQKTKKKTTVSETEVSYRSLNRQKGSIQVIGLIKPPSPDIMLFSNFLIFDMCFDFWLCRIASKYYQCRTAIFDYELLSISLQHNLALSIAHIIMYSSIRYTVTHSPRSKNKTLLHGIRLIAWCVPCVS